MSIRKVRMFPDGYEHEINDEGMVRCPVCGEFTFDEPNDNTYCENCEWFNFEFLITIPGFTGPLKMTFEEAKKAYAEGREII